MKVIFISGPYRGESYQEICNNISLAKAAAIKLWREGYAVICPHLNTAHFDGLCPDEVWLEGDLEILRHCDAIYMLKAWRDSAGAKTELKLAQELGFEILYQS
jgi:hypothetical protein